MNTPDFTLLISRLENAAAAARFLLPYSGNHLAALLSEAAEAIRQLTRYAAYYEQKASQARTEPIKLIVETIEDWDGRGQGEEPWAR